MRKGITILTASCLAFVAMRLPAQEPVKPGPEHEEMKKMVGEWDATISMMGQTSKGTMTWKSGLGGLWILSHFKGDFGGMAFEGHGASTYDPAKKKYIDIWLDSMSTQPMVSEGTYEKSTRTLSLAGESSGPDGKAMKMKMTSRMVDDDNIVFTMNTAGADGKDAEMMKITYKRRGK